MPEQVITTEEIDALMQAVQSGAVSGSSEPGARQVKAYDFTRPNKFSREQVRALEMIHAGCARDLTTQFSALLRMPVEVEMAGIAETTAQDLAGDAAPNASIALLRLEPLPGRAALDMDPALVFALIDRLLGGPGMALPEARELTEIEKGLMRRAVEQVAHGLAGAWKPLIALQPELEKIVGSGLFSQSASPDERFVLVRFTARMGSVSGTMRLGIPIASLDPVLSRLSVQQWSVSENRSGGEAVSQAIRQSLEPAEVLVSGELGRAAMKVRDLLDLQIGDLVCLNRKAGADLDIRVGSLVRFQGQPGQVGRRFGLRITRALDGEEE